ncbi:LysR family transcriptional regulator [Paenibacillus sp. FSL P2-0136]|uniref:LysR family transcriptional regulator n=1 Tax=Paenibacillus sp. FSL P2-0136 TaxID=2975317 RepID=UPI0030D88E88
MNLHALKIFHTISEKGGVTRAAEELRISQPAVTAQVRNLEKELGIQLLAPKGRGILVTDAGQMLASHAKRLFALERELDEAVREYKAGFSGILRIVATYLPANLLLPEWLALYKQEHPSVEVVLNTANSREAVEGLLQYDAEVAVYGGGWEEQPGIEWEELLEDELWFIVPRNHPYGGQEITLAEMMKVPFILREEGSSTRERLFSLCRALNVSPPKVGLQFNGVNEMVRAVIAGYGAIFISSLAVRDNVERGEVERVMVNGTSLLNPIAVCTRKQEALSPAAAAFLSLVREQSKGGARN